MSLMDEIMEAENRLFYEHMLCDYCGHERSRHSRTDGPCEECAAMPKETTAHQRAWHLFEEEVIGATTDCIHVSYGEQAGGFLICDDCGEDVTLEIYKSAAHRIEITDEEVPF